MTVVAASVTWFVFGGIASILVQVTGKGVPAITAAMSLSAKSSTLAAEAPSLSVAENEEERRKIASTLRERLNSVSRLIAEISTNEPDDEEVQLIQRSGGMIASAIDALDTSVKRREDASVDVQTVACAAEELFTSIAEIGRQVGESTKIAGHAVDQAMRTNRTVQGLAAAAQKIGEVVSMIKGIAGQTKLLALNATIEAASAGEAGKGFAIVASEVRALAEDTAKATEEIASQIGSVQDVSGDAVSVIQTIGDTVTHINRITTTIAASIEHALRPSSWRKPHSCRLQPAALLAEQSTMLGHQVRKVLAQIRAA